MQNTRLVKVFTVIIIASLIVCLDCCNMFYVTVYNLPVFFSAPKKVLNKIKEPLHSDVRLSALWIGHSTMLIQMDDKVIITDPFLTETVGELARRVIEPGIDIKDIPKCDLILISHSHFDHLSYGSLEILEEKSPNANLIFPEELKNYLPDYSFNFVPMINNNGYKYGFMGETKSVSGIKVTSVYAQHWGGRYGLDGFIWGDNAFTGFMLEYNGMTVYFAGDTGYDSTKFKQIGEKFNIDLSIIPNGPCAECMQNGTSNHVFPPDAVQLFKDVKAKWMIPVHYGTLQFAQADPMEPIYALKKIINEQNLSDKINVLEIGQQKIYYYK